MPTPDAVRDGFLLSPAIDRRESSRDMEGRWCPPAIGMPTPSAVPLAPLPESCGPDCECDGGTNEPCCDASGMDDAMTILACCDGAALALPSPAGSEAAIGASS